MMFEELRSHMQVTFETLEKRDLEIAMVKTELIKEKTEHTDLQDMYRHKSDQHDTQKKLYEETQEALDSELERVIKL